MKKLLFSILSGTLIAAAPASLAKDPLISLPGTNRAVPDSQLQVQLSYAPVVKDTAPAVVNVYTSRTVRARSRLSFFDMMRDMRLGDIVLAIGNPFGVGQTVTSGIVSALGRTNVTDVSSFIQTDAAVNPGNSGGALVSLGGQLDPQRACGPRCR